MNQKQLFVESQVLKQLSVLPLRLFLLAGLLLVSLVAGNLLSGYYTPVSAQTISNGIVDQQKPVIEDLRQQTDAIAKLLEKSKVSDAELVNFRVQLDGISKKLLNVGLSFRPRLSEINSRLEQLGTAPAEGQPAEAELLASERTRLTAEKTAINTAIGLTEDVSVQANQLIETISTLRRQLFSETLSQRVELNAQLVTEVVNAAGHETKTFFYLLKSWWDFTLFPKLWTFFGVLIVSIIPPLGFHLFARYWLADLYERDPNELAPSYFKRLSAAFWSTVIPSLGVVIFCGLVYVFMQYFHLLRPDVAQLLSALFTLFCLVSFVYWLARGVLSPDMENWRLMPVAPHSARLLLWLLTTAAIVQSMEYFLEVLNDVLSSPLSLTVAKSVVGTALVGMLVLAIAFVKPIQDPETGALRPWPKLLKAGLCLLGMVPLIAALFGYIGFSRFVAQQIVVTGAFLVTMYLGFLTAHAITVEDEFANTTIGRSLRKKFNASDATLDQLGLLAGIIIMLIVLMIGIPLVLKQFGFQWPELRTAAMHILTGFQVGSFSISLLSVLSGIIIFVVGYSLTRLFQNWLDGSVMARGRVEAGVRNSIKTVCGYIGLGLSLLVALSAAGVNFSNLALIAGGLSLGIGFGLQTIVSNFVSGLILLAERPFKVGDWVQTDTVTGFVKKISVRATEVETFQRETIIVPNSSLINNNVGNWTHRNTLGRSDSQILVGYRENAREIQELLLEIAKEVPLVLKNPEPAVFLINMTELVGTNLMMRFEIRVFLADILTGMGVRTELQLRIIERFAKEKISLMPVAQTDPLAAFQYSSEDTVSEISSV